jgi:hypothetical protein
MAVVPPPVRVSLSALLRVKDDDRYVLFHSPFRPGVYGPPGGVLKFYPPAARILEDLGFEEERSGSHPEVMKRDLRGKLPAAALRRFLRWFDTGAYREDTAECLRRELAEEFGEVGFASFGVSVAELGFTRVRTVVEGPAEVLGKPYRQLRRFEVYDLLTADGLALRLTEQLLEIGEDPGYPDVVCATRAEIVHGRHEKVLIAPQSAFLIGTARMSADFPAVP